MRVLLLGAETDAGAAIAKGLAEAGAGLALVAATTQPEAAFAVQRLARRLGALAQAVDAPNETAVRVMVRQVAKRLGGLDAVVFCEAPLDPPPNPALAEEAMRARARAGLHLLKYAGRELDRSGGGPIVLVGQTVWAGHSADEPAAKWWPVQVRDHVSRRQEVVEQVLQAVSGGRRGRPG